MFISIYLQLTLLYFALLYFTLLYPFEKYIQLAQLYRNDSYENFKPSHCLLRQASNDSTEFRQNPRVQSAHIKYLHTGYSVAQFIP
jgi:hypothetical protein